MQIKLSIIIPTYNHLNDGLKLCCDSIVRNTDFKDYTIEVIVVANGCTDKTEDYVLSLGTPFILLSYPQALGFSQAVNKALAVATGDYIILLNNDTMLLDNSIKNVWINILLEPFLTDSNCGITGPIKQYVAEMSNYFLIFFCVMISRKVLDSIGCLDESFLSGSGEDVDYCIRAMQKGFKIIQVPQNKEIKNVGDKMIGEFPIYHTGELTVNDLPNWQETFNKNMKTVFERYKVKYMKVAVITPLYNNENQIINAIESVKNQNVQIGTQITHYIYNDGSTDKSQQIVDDYILNNHDIRIVFLKSNKREGQSHARNALIKEAFKTTDGPFWIAFLDADDEWHYNHLDNVTLLGNDSDGCYSRPYCHDGEIQVFPFGIVAPHQFIGKQLEHNNFIWISGMIVKSQCFENGAEEFDSNLDGLEDWDMWYRLYKKGCKFTFIDDITFKYLVSASGAAAKSNEKLDKLRTKHGFSLQQINLNIACGEDYQQAYINCDLYPSQAAKVDTIFDVRKIPYDDNTVDTIRAFYIIEHFDFHEGQKVLKEWCRVLKPDGKLIIETHDFLMTCKAFVESDEVSRLNLYNNFFELPWVVGQTHKFLFTETQLMIELQWAGFRQCARIAPTSRRALEQPAGLFLAIEACK